MMEPWNPSNLPAKAWFAVTVLLLLLFWLTVDGNAERLPALSLCSAPSDMSAALPAIGNTALQPSLAASLLLVSSLAAALLTSLLLLSLLSFSSLLSLSSLLGSCSYEALAPLPRLLAAVPFTASYSPAAAVRERVVRAS
jgi:hypothetical protein